MPLLMLLVELMLHVGRRTILQHRHGEGQHSTKRAIGGGNYITAD